MDLYEAIMKRRDVRHFKSTPIDPALVTKILNAAHHAGSVGFMQPWNFIVIQATETKQAIHDIFVECNEHASELYSGPRRELYKSLKLAGICESPVNIAVTCRHDAEDGSAVLGRNTMPEMDLFSTCCAIQNLWLAARAEGLGVGWVSIIDPVRVKEILAVPKEVSLVGYLCVGYPKEFEDEPLLAKAGWRQRLALEQVVYHERWLA